MKAALLATLVFISQDDAGADALVQGLNDRLARAKTVRVEYKLTLGAGGQVAFESEGVIKVKGADHCAMNLKYRQGFEGLGQTEEISATLLCDGRKVITTGPRRVPHQGEPRKLVEEIRKNMKAAIVMPLQLWAPVSREQTFVFSKVKDAGKDKIEGMEARGVEYILTIDRQETKVKAYFDAAGTRLLRRELSMQGLEWVETFTAFAFDEDLPDSDFTYQSKRRLAQAQAAQLVRSVELFGLFTGRHPASLEELLRRPADLPPEVFWPERGFVLGGALPRDPWGKPFELARDGGRARVVSRGADGAPGGGGEGQDLAADAPAVHRRAVGAPTERLKRHYAARVELHLLAAAVRAFRESYGELPKKKAALWEKPDWAEVWPEGGWLPGGNVPPDPWGQEYRIISEPYYVRVQVQDPKARLLLLKDLSAEERARLDEAARPRFSEAERKEIGRLLRLLADDDLETREKAESDLKAWGPGAGALLDEHLKGEKDAEAAARIRAIRKAIPERAPGWSAELGALALTVTPSDPVVSGAPAANERNASATLKTFSSAQADFRANDRDGNKINDFWTGDVAGLYSMTDASVKGNKDGPIKLIEISAAAADAAPLEEGAAAGELVPIESLTARAPKAGYYFRVMLKDEEGEPYQKETEGEPKMGKVHNPSKFAICAYPAEYGVTGTRTFILNEGNTIFSLDTHGEPVLEWPSDEQLREWSKRD